MVISTCTAWLLGGCLFHIYQSKQTCQRGHSFGREGYIYSRLMRESTVVLTIVSFSSVDRVLKPLSIWITGSFNIQMDEPFPNNHSPSRFSTSWPTNKLVHPHDARPPLVVFRKSLFRKYRPLRTRTYKAFCSNRIRSTIFTLNVWISQNPHLPSSFSLTIIYHHF